MNSEQCHEQAMNVNLEMILIYGVFIGVYILLAERI
jgi:hypothetical protein